MLVAHGCLEVAKDDDHPSLPPGTVLGGYTLGERLGAGGLAEVYAARDARAAREVALKTLRLEYCLLSEFVERMQREAVMMTRIRHPNVVMCWGAGLDGRRPWLALERLRGATLRQKLEEGPLWPHDVMSLAHQAASGLRTAHAQGIVHRDLKPENLFIEPHRLVLLDFGFARSSQHGTLTDPFVAPGTIAYMAPEQILRKPADVRTDVYSLGVCMYEALAGHHPFVNEPGVWPDDDVMARFHLEDPPCPLPELIEGFPSSIWNIVERCLSKDPEKRYASMLALASDLRAEEQRLAVEQPPARFGDLWELWQSWKIGKEPPRSSAPTSGLALSTLPVILWRDLFVFVEGKTKVEDYEILERMAFEQSSRYPGGLGCLVIIPETAVPPSDEARRAIKALMQRMGSTLRCLCWAVEGSGFQAAAVRAIIAGLRVIERPPYPTKIATNLTSGLTWILSHVSSGSSVMDVAAALEAIHEARKAPSDMGRALG